MDQFFILITGVAAVFLTQQSEEEWKRYACLFGMAGQPFWFYFAYEAEAWGIFGNSILYTYCWGLGIKNNWLTQPIKNEVLK